MLSLATVPNLDSSDNAFHTNNISKGMRSMGGEDEKKWMGQSLMNHNVQFVLTRLQETS